MILGSTIDFQGLGFYLRCLLSLGGKFRFHERLSLGLGSVSEVSLSNLGLGSQVKGLPFDLGVRDCILGGSLQFKGLLAII